MIILGYFFLFVHEAYVVDLLSLTNPLIFHTMCALKLLVMQQC